jgi:ascorbate-specific PTS system EIIC-type component UlaA
MVVGMLWNFIGSFIIVLIMMIILLRSVVAGFVSMIPMTVTILFIYGALGWTGKEYDMPVAVLSALTLGLAIDFAIHFIERAKAIYAVHGRWPQTAEEMFLTPYRAILRNAIVISIGSCRYLFHPCALQYGRFFHVHDHVFCQHQHAVDPAGGRHGPPGCIFYEAKKNFLSTCPQCLLMSLVVAGAVAYVLVAYSGVRWNAATLVALACVVALSMVCALVSRSKQCFFVQKGKKEKEGAL